MINLGRLKKNLSNCESYRLQDTEISHNFYIYPINALVNRQENLFLETTLNRKIAAQELN